MIDFEDEKKRLEALFADTTPEQQLNTICLDLVSPLASFISGAELLKQTLADVDKTQLPEEFERLVDHIHSTAAKGQ